MSWLSNLFGGSGPKESQTIRRARESGGNVSGFVLCVDLLDDAVTKTAAETGIRFRPGARERIRAVFRDEISADGTDKVMLQQTLAQVLAQMQIGQIQPTTNPNTFIAPPGYQLIPVTTTPQVPVAATQQLVWEEETKEEVEPTKGKKKKV